MLTSDVEALYAAVAAAPDDHHLRAVLADALEDAEGTAECPNECSYIRATNNHCTWEEVADGGFAYWECQVCSGTGHVSNGCAALAAGYRALGEFGKRAFVSNRTRYVFFSMLIFVKHDQESNHLLPVH